MGTRGRQSAAALTVVGPSGIETVRRPEPPDELTDEQASEWKAIVSRMPADWFGRETHGMLAQYCRHVIASRRVAQLIEANEQSDDFSLEAYDTLLKMQEREGRAMSALATRMRISQQASYDKQKKKPHGPAKRPWEADG
jgi:hypothetical protein